MSKMNIKPILLIYKNGQIEFLHKKKVVFKIIKIDIIFTITNRNQ
ncbi:MAG: hypothetical protein PWR03_2068 [Tenuifilum sp.]|jgi:hypothetical protein|nr:hypothetical protein [Tenuifilum sp.]